MINDYPQVLSIAGFDSDGSAGMPADLHTFFAHKVYGMGILTAAVAGNSYQIEDATMMPLSFIAQQFDTLAKDFDIRASKTGMLSSKEMIKVVVEKYQEVNFGPLVVDPVIVTKHGNKLIDDDAIDFFKENLIPLAEVITPNYFEARTLTNLELKNDKEIHQAAKYLHELGAKNVIIKGKHHKEDGPEQVRDLVSLENGDIFWLEHDYLDTNRINGTGDTLAAAITSHLALGDTVKEAITKSVNFTHDAIAHEIQVGHQYGPINHWAAMDRLN
ncbi:bifunctional hydroxymethylpyrimidine kinase/phosphomethylpyrimidine kinase [Holzapfeliella sp. He02]|uniref:Hydroxymethylpyrimidine/phosphomethylpyrimidine kinase n=1 Tax=Holzapfeliella saturejae TaxID=3082953 RepID=A0ABU8SEK2_9LACO